MVDNHAQRSKEPPQSNDILQICRGVADGDQDARRRLMEILFNRIHKTASYLSCNIEEARDIAQTACIEVLLSAGSFQGNATIAYWADRVTIQTAATIFAKKTRRQRLREKFLQPPRSMTTADEQAAQQAIRTRLTALLQSLKHRQREAVVLRYIQGYTNQEVADLCEVPLETARDRLKKGRAALKKKVMADPLLSEWIREWGKQ